ncbi:MAG TPA: TetR/AcrR family transcriptional regulator [Acidimicrobiales bacterium]|nr:TetR/AcrR family transcriptional regulator [Acidimicrobiales bacterium]
MSTSDARRRGSNRSRRFSTDEVVDAALRCVERDGLDALTMRAVATELGASPMALYRYVDGREDLVARTVDRSLAGFDFPDLPAADAPGAELAAWLRAMAVEGRIRLLRYPGTADHLLLHGPTGPWSILFMDQVCKVIALTGREPTEVAWAYDWLMTTAAAYISKEARLGDGGSKAAVSLQQLAADVAKYPDLIPVVATFTGVVGDSYTRATNLVIDALTADPSPPGPASAGRSAPPA